MATVAKIAPKAQPIAGTINWLDDCIERGKGGVFSELTTLTPGLAAELLRRNPDNRFIRQTKAAQYACDIRTGRWVFNGEPIIIADTGELNDGQHRASAVVEANISIPALLVFGLPRETRTTLDQGAARNAGDYLSMDNVPNPTVQASIARLVIAWECAEGQTLSANKYVTNAEVLARVKADDMIAESAHFAAGNAKNTRAFCAPAVIGLCHYIFSDINPSQANEYMHQVCRGEGLKARDPAYTVRDRLISLGNKSRDQRTHIIIRGWNAYRQGRSLALAKIVGKDNLPALV